MNRSEMIDLSGLRDPLLYTFGTYLNYCDLLQLRLVSKEIKRLADDRIVRYQVVTRSLNRHYDTVILLSCMRYHELFVTNGVCDTSSITVSISGKCAMLQFSNDQFHTVKSKLRPNEVINSVNCSVSYVPIPFHNRKRVGLLAYHILIEGSTVTVCEQFSFGTFYYTPPIKLLCY